ncbi:VOC family protein [Streptomyces shaanxiensis]
MIKVAMTSVYVDDISRAHAFYTDVLGCDTRVHMDLGGGTLFVTVGAPEGARPDLQLLLEPGQGPIADPYRKAVREAGLPCIVFSVDDIEAEYERLRKLGVESRPAPCAGVPAVAGRRGGRRPGESVAPTG